MNWTEEQVKEAENRARMPQDQSEAPGRSKVSFNPQRRPQTAVYGQRGMNKTEAEYAKKLELERVCGAVQWWKYEAIKLRLADLTFYTPDFVVVKPSGPLEFHETKGGFIRDDAAAKFKIAAEMYPEFRFLMLRKGKNGEWDVLKDLNHA